MRRLNFTGVAILGALATSCSLIVANDNTYDPRVDSGPGDAGMAGDAGTDAGPDAGPPPLPAPALRFPWNGYMTGSARTGALDPPLNALRPRFMWEPVEGADGYEIQLSWRCEAATRQTCEFMDPVDGTTAMTEWRPETPLDVSLVVPVGRRFYWRVRACRDTECFDWSAVRYVDVGRQLTDFNADGYADVLVGHSSSTAGVGATPYLYEGPDLTSPPLTLRSTPDAGEDIYVFAAGDVDADGFPDAIFMAFDQSAAWIYSNGQFANTEALPQGEALPCGGGDLNGDGFSDVVTACPDCDVVQSGEVYLHLGSALDVDPSLSVALSSPMPETAGLFGQGVSISGDIDGDGYVDLIVGAPQESGVAVSQSGRTYIFPGGPDGPGAPRTVENPMPMLRGGFGVTAGGGDANCDGFGDFMVSASKVGDPALHFFLGGRSDPEFVLLVTTSSPTDELGAWGSFFGDLDGDGSSDLFATIHESAPVVDTAGAAAWFGSCDAPLTDTPQEFLSVSGRGIATIGDVDGDGRAEIVTKGATNYSVWGWSDATSRMEQRQTLTGATSVNNVAGTR